MIKMQELTPDVYYNNSRDFQLICHLFDLVLNSTKTEADILFSLPLSANSPEHLLNLMSTTFGLRLDITKYTSTQLRAVCSIAPKLMRYKGSLTAIHYLVADLMRSDGSAEAYLIEQDKNNPYHITILLPTHAQHKAILEELLPYITPAGVTYSIKQAFLIIKEQEAHYSMADSVTISTEHSSPHGMLVQHKDTAEAGKNFFVRDGVLRTKPGFWPVASLVPDATHPATVPQALPEDYLSYESSEAPPFDKLTPSQQTEEDEV